MSEVIVVMPLPSSAAAFHRRVYEYLMAWRAVVAVYLPAATDSELKALVEPLRIKSMNTATQPEASLDLFTGWCDALLTIAQGGGGLDEMREYVGIITEDDHGAQ